MDRLLSRDDVVDKDGGGGKPSQEELFKQRLAAFDRDMSVLSTVVTAIKSLKNNASHLSLLASSPGSMQELRVPRRDSISSEKCRLLGWIFLEDEDDVAWNNLSLVHSIDAITGLEWRRRQDLGAIAEKLGIRTAAQLAAARSRMDPSRDALELLVAQNTQAQWLFRTVFLGTRICVRQTAPPTQKKAGRVVADHV